MVDSTMLSTNEGFSRLQGPLWKAVDVEDGWMDGNVTSDISNGPTPRVRRATGVEDPRMMTLMAC